MGNFTASEIFTIIVVILIVFGPNRLPEIARKAGNLAARARSAMDSLKAEINTEYGDAIAPLRDARNELRAAGSEIKGQVAEFGREVNTAGRELKAAADDAVKPMSAGGPSAAPAESQDGGAAPADAAPSADQDTGAAPADEVKPNEAPIPQDGLELDGG